MFLFFKQKTAYEMRISDWSSDVCSSDLNASENPSCGSRRAHFRLRPSPSRISMGLSTLMNCLGAFCSTMPAERSKYTKVAALPSMMGDRKSVVKGKSVSVRVDLGGRRIIKKKNTKTIHKTRTT